MQVSGVLCWLRKRSLTIHQIFDILRIINPDIIVIFKQGDFGLSSSNSGGEMKVSRISVSHNNPFGSRLLKPVNFE